MGLQEYRKDHAKVCLIKLLLPPTANYYKCLSCSEIINTLHLDYHRKHCTSLSSVSHQPEILNCPICYLPLIRAKLKGHLEKCQPLAFRFKAGEIFRCADCAGPVKVTKKNSHSNLCTKGLLNKDAKSNASVLEIKFEKVSSKSASGVNCSFCRQYVNNAMFKEHSSECRGRYKLIQDARPNNSPINTSSRQYKDPMGIKAMLNQRGPIQPTGNSKVEPGKPIKATSTKASTNSVSDQSKRECPNCHGQVKLTNFEEHRKNCAGTNKQNSKSKRSFNPRDNWQESFDDNRHSPGVRKDDYQDLGYDDRMDATRGQGYRAREHGRFGSHPIHDNYDD